MANQRKTGKGAATAASKILRDVGTKKDAKKAAASAMSQAAPKKKRKQAEWEKLTQVFVLDGIIFMKQKFLKAKNGHAYPKSKPAQK